MKTKYSLKEKIVLIVLAGLGVASLFFYSRYGSLAFPEHSIKFDINRKEAAVESTRFVKSLNYELSGYKQATIFNVDTEGKTYLEKELSVAETSKLSENDVDLWGFDTRFFKPLQKEEFAVSIMPNGRVTGFRHDIEEVAAGASLSQEEAKQAAEKFLSQKLERNLTDWNLINTEKQDRPNRLDYTFTWEKRDFKAKEATYRIELGIWGDQVGSYQEFLKVPESWERSYEIERSHNDLAQIITEALLYIIFGISLLMVLGAGIRDGQIRWRFAAWVGGLVVIFNILASLNALPTTIYTYGTTESWGSFIAFGILMMIIGSLFEGFMVSVIVAASELTYRQYFKDRVILEKLFTNGLSTKSVNLGIILGTILALLDLTYVVVYYLVGRKIGFWAPADIKYDDLFSTAIPWVYPILIGFSAAVTEEGIFRLFGIPFLTKKLRSPWLAIVITAVVWGFLHSNYPQSPWFARGIEVSLAGLLYGYVFVRFGIVATFVTHYTFNALLTALFMFNSGNLYVGLSSTLVALLPAIIGLVCLIVRKGKFIEPKAELLNSDLPRQINSLPAKDRKPDPVWWADNSVKEGGLSKRTTAILATLAALGLIIGWKIIPATTLEETPVTVGRNEAIDLASNVLKSKGVTTDTYRAGVMYLSNYDTYGSDYLLDRGNFETVRQIFPSQIPTAYWQVRFLRPLEKEEYTVTLLPNGQVYDVSHLIEEAAKGENLNQDEALKIAQDYLVNQKNYNLSNYNLVESKSDKRDNRTDYTFTYEDKSKIVDAGIRTDLVVQGNEPTQFRKYLKIPEEWERKRSEIKAKDSIAIGLIALLFIGMLILGIKTLVEMIRFHEIDTIRFRKFAVLAAGLGIIEQLNSLSSFYSYFPTTTPIVSSILEQAIFAIIGFVFSVFFIAVAIGIFESMWERYIGLMPKRFIDVKSKEFKDAIILSYTVPAIGIAGAGLVEYALIKFDLLRNNLVGIAPAGIDRYVPALSIIDGIPSQIVSVMMGIAAFILLYKYLKSWRNVVLLGALCALIVSVPNNDLKGFLATIIQALLAVAAASIVVFGLIRKNLLAYIGLFFVSTVAAAGWELLGQGTTFYKINGMVVLAIALLPLLIYVVSLFRPDRTTNS